MSWNPMFTVMLLGEGPFGKRLRPLIKESTRTSLVAQCLRLHLPMQRVWVWSLVRELRSHVPCDQKTKQNKTYNWNNIIAISILWRISLVAQWLGTHLSVQGTWVLSLVQEDPTCCRAIKLVPHSYWAPAPRVRSPQEKLPQWEAHVLLWRVAPAHCN